MTLTYTFNSGPKRTVIGLYSSKSTWKAAAGHNSPHVCGLPYTSCIWNYNVTVDTVCKQEGTCRKPKVVPTNCISWRLSYISYLHRRQIILSNIHDFWSCLRRWKQNVSDATLRKNMDYRSESSQSIQQCAQRNVTKVEYWGTLSKRRRKTVFFCYSLWNQRCIKD